MASSVHDAKAEKVSIALDTDKGTVSVDGCHVDNLLLYNIDGRMVKQTVASRMDVSGLASGVYVVRVIDGNDQYTKKVRL